MRYQWGALLEKGKFSLVRRGFATEETLIAEGEAGRSLFFLSKGRVNVRTECDGRLLSLYTHREGAVFGEMALLSSHPRSATVVAETDVVIYELDATDFDLLLEHAPTTAAKLMRNIALGLTATVRSQTETIRQLEA